MLQLLTTIDIPPVCAVTRLLRLLKHLLDPEDLT